MNTLKTKHLIMITVFSAILFTACGQQQNRSAVNNIFGDDNREDITSGDFPYAAIGRLDLGCTGTLVGKGLMLTAAHCLIDSSTGSLKPQLGFFRPDFKQGRSEDKYGYAHIWYGSANPSNNRGDDWAIVKLTENAGDKYGWLEMQHLDFENSLPFTTNLAGYHMDRSDAASPSAHFDCQIHARVGERLMNDCDSTTGISGGPLFNIVDERSVMVAMAVSEYRRGAPGSVTREEYTQEYANVAIGTHRFLDTALKLRETVDLGLEAPELENVLDIAAPVRPEDPDQVSFENLRSAAELGQASANVVKVVRGIKYACRDLDYAAGRYNSTELQEISQRLVAASDTLVADTRSISRGSTGETAREGIFQTFVDLQTADADLREFQSQSSDQYLASYLHSRIRTLERSLDRLIDILFIR